MTNKKLLKILVVNIFIVLLCSNITAIEKEPDYSKPGVYKVNGSHEVYVLEKRNIKANDITLSGKDFVIVDNIYKLDEDEIIKKAGIETNKLGKLEIIIGSSPCYEICLDQIRVIAKVDDISLTVNAYKPNTKNYKKLYVEDAAEYSEANISGKTDEITYSESRNVKKYREIYMNHTEESYMKFLPTSLAIMYFIPLSTVIVLTNRMKKLRDYVIYGIVNNK